MNLKSRNFFTKSPIGPKRGRILIQASAIAALLACGLAQHAGAQIVQFYWKDNANNGNWDWGGSQWFSSQTSGNVGAPNYNGGAQLFFESVGNTTTTINNAGSGGGAPSGWIALNAIFTQNSTPGKVYTINSGTGVNGIYLYNKIETLAIGTPAGLTINSALQLGGATEVNAVSANIQLGNLLFNGKTLNSFGNKQLNITGVMSGTGAYNIKNQGVTVTYSGAGANTFSGTTTVENTSTLVLNKSANTAAIAGQLVINSGAIVRTDAANQLSNQLVTVNGTLNLNGNNQSAALAGSGAVTLGAGTLSINNTASDTFSGIISGGGGMTKTGVGTQILSNTQTYTGATNITQGILQLNGSTHASSTVGIGTAGTLTGTGTVNGNATLTGNGVINKSAGTIAGTLGVTGGNWNGAGAVTGAVTSSSGTFTIGSGANLTANGGLNVTGGTIAAGSGSSTITGSLNYTSSASSSFSGVIAGAGKTVTMNAAGSTLALSGTNSYGGATAVTQGSLLINGTNSGTGAVNVSNGATLGGTGSVAGAVNVSGVLAPGASIESLGTGALSFMTGSTFAYELDSSSLGGDLIHSTDTLSIASNASLTLTELFSGTLAVGSKLTLISYLGGWNSSDLFIYDSTPLADDSTFTLGSNTWLFNYNDTVGGTNFSGDQAGATSFVTMTVIPEPSTAALGLLGISLLLRRRRVR